MVQKRPQGKYLKYVLLAIKFVKFMKFIKLERKGTERWPKIREADPCMAVRLKASLIVMNPLNS